MMTGPPTQAALLVSACITLCKSQPEKSEASSPADVRRFGHAINTDEVFGTHTANFPRSAALRLLPTCETPAQQHARWRRRILLRDGAPCDRAYVATGALHTFERTLQHRRGCAR